MRLTATGKLFAYGTTIYVDTLITNRTQYTAHDVTENRLEDLFAQVNVGCGTSTLFRAESAPSRLKPFI
eukprot:6741799-Prymnesium_polylepis.1